MPASRRELPIFLLIATTWLVFWPTLSAGFVGWDDPEMVAANPGLNPPSWHGVAEFWRRPVINLYTPLAYTVWSGVAAIEHVPPDKPLNPAPFHFLNLLLHTAAVVAVFLLLCELIGHIWPAWAGAMVFAIHPLQVEAVAWVSGMNNLLFGALAVAALWQYVRYAKTGGRWHFASATLLYAAALLSKPTAVVVPLLAAALDRWLLARPLKRSAPLLLWTAMAVPIAVVARIVQPPMEVWPMSFFGRILAAIDAVGFYFVKLVGPIHLAMDYQRTPRWLMDHPAAAWAGILVLLAAAILYLRAKWLRAPLIIALAALLPVLGLVSFDFQSYSTVADRYMYMPILGVAIGIAIAISRTKLKPVAAGGLFVLLLLAVRSFIQTAVWHDTQSLALNELSLDSDSSTGHKILAEWLSDQGRDTEAEPQFRAAIAALQRQQKPGNGAVQYDYANLLRRHGRLDEAIAEYQAAIPLLAADQVPKALNNLGVAYLLSGDTADARAQFNRAVALQPGYAEAQRNLDQLDAANPR
jgi:protein O-mannosyl-transferase